jgi:hypothetical protein
MTRPRRARSARNAPAAWSARRLIASVRPEPRLLTERADSARGAASRSTANALVRRERWPGRRPPAIVCREPGWLARGAVRRPSATARVKPASTIEELAAPRAAATGPGEVAFQAVSVRAAHRVPSTIAAVPSSDAAGRQQRPRRYRLVRSFATSGILDPAAPACNRWAAVRTRIST